MGSVEHVVKEYLSSGDLSSGDVVLGGGQVGFDTQLERARSRARVGFWICFVMLVVLFVSVVFVSLRSFDQLVALGATGVAGASGLFGASAAACVQMMMRWSREGSRAEILLVFLRDLRKRKPAEFDHIVVLLAREWYGLAPVDEKKATPTPTAP